MNNPSGNIGKTKEFRTPRQLQGQRGSVLIEFAFVLLFFILPLLFGIIEFGILYYDRAVITNASREGARAGIALKDNPRLLEGEIAEVVDRYTRGRLITFGEYQPPETETDPKDGNPAGGVLTVNVSYYYDFLILPRLWKMIFSGDGKDDEPLKQTATTVMTYEGDY